MAKRILLLCLVLAALLWWAPCRAQASEVEGIYEKSGAGELYGALDQDTQDLLSQAGIGEGSWESGDGGQLFQALSQLLREKLAAPLKGLAVLLGVVVLCRLGASSRRAEAPPCWRGRWPAPVSSPPPCWS